MKYTKDRKSEILKALKNVEDNIVLYGTHLQGGSETFKLDCPCLVFALSEVRKAKELVS